MFRRPGPVGPDQIRTCQSHWQQDGVRVGTGQAPVPALLCRDEQVFGFLKNLLGGRTQPQGGLPPPGVHGVDELARRLGMSATELRGVAVAYHAFEIPKRSGGRRRILAPSAPLKALQRRVLHRLLRRLRAHPSATGFERRHSIATNALPHTGQAVVVRLDLKEFFQSTSAARVEAYFRTIGWDAQAARLLTELCTYEGSLPQGAPTSPRLSNLVNHRLDARLAALAEARGMAYSRYADDITFSGGDDAGTGAVSRPRVAGRINELIYATKRIAKEEGYTLHIAKKLRIARRHDRQMVTGLVVNVKPNLPREVRRRLRAIEHRLRTGRQATLTPQQLAGWRSLQKMITAQAANADQ